MLSEKDWLLIAVPGIGPIVLATLLGELSELGTRCRRKIVSLAGLVPHARESGTWHGTRRIPGSRRMVRETLRLRAYRDLLQRSESRRSGPGRPDTHVAGNGGGFRLLQAVADLEP